MMEPIYLFGTFGIGVATMFGASFGIDKYLPKYIKEHKNGVDIIVSKDEPMRKYSFYALTIGTGMVMAPIFGIILDISPEIIPLSLFLSTSIFGGCAYISTKIKSATMMSWKVPLYSSLSTLLSVQLLNLGALLICGPNSFTELLTSIDVYGGIGLFTMMSIYDSYRCQAKYLKGKPDTLGCATQLFLDFMNLLIRIMEAMAKAKKK